MGTRISSVAFRWLSLGFLASLASFVAVARAQDVPPPVPVDPNNAAAAYPSADASGGYSSERWGFIWGNRVWRSPPHCYWWIQAVLENVSHLQRAAGGLGLRFSINGLFIPATGEIRT